MERIRTQEDFISKSKEIYNDKYDYSLVQYSKSSVKVKIICPEHGIFEKTPNKHLQGQGCPICGRNRTKVDLNEFIRRAMSIHGDKYDYSKVVYVTSETPVEIICPTHGSFMQKPHNHISLSQGCPKCANINGGKKRSGANNVAHREDVKKKKMNTCISKYGTTTWAASDEGRRKLHNIIVDEKLDIMKSTCQERYGTDFWTQSDEGKEKLHQIMSSDDMQEKIRHGYEAMYGMHYMQTPEGREKASHYIDDERREKMRQSMMEHLGVPCAFMSPEVRQKIEQTCIKKYGVGHVVFSEEERKKILEKSWATKRKNGTYNTSVPEDTLYKLLCDVFGEDNVESQYIDALRYPFHCDFYVKSLDLFIELNAHWSHGGHWFDENNEDDLKRLEFLMNKAEEKGSRYYHAAIYTWTERDLLKKSTAEKNNLNYVVFWKQDLSDAREYLSSYR